MTTGTARSQDALHSAAQRESSEDSGTIRAALEKHAQEILANHGSALSSRIGESEAATKKALTVLVPTVTALVLKNARSESAASKLIETIKAATQQGVLVDDQDDFFSSEVFDRIAASAGMSQLIQAVVSYQLQSVLESASALSGVKKTGVGALLAVTLATVLGVFKRYLAGQTDAKSALFSLAQSENNTNVVPKDSNRINLPVSEKSAAEALPPGPLMESALLKRRTATSWMSATWIVPACIIFAACFALWYYFATQQNVSNLQIATLPPVSVSERASDVQLNASNGSQSISPSSNNESLELASQAAELQGSVSNPGASEMPLEKSSAGDLQEEREGRTGDRARAELSRLTEQPIGPSFTVIDEGTKSFLLPSNESIVFPTGGAIEQVLLTVAGGTPKDVSVAASKATGGIILDEVAFEPNSNRISKKSEEQLRALATILKAYPTQKVVLNGYTDASGSSKRNTTLSLARAKSVQKYLAKEKVPTGQVQTAGRGQENPVASNETAEGRVANRRIEIEFLPAA